MQVLPRRSSLVGCRGLIGEVVNRVQGDHALVGEFPSWRQFSPKVPKYVWQCSWYRSTSPKAKVGLLYVPDAGHHSTHDLNCHPAVGMELGAYAPSLISRTANEIDRHRSEQWKPLLWCENLIRTIIRADNDRKDFCTCQ